MCAAAEDLCHAWKKAYEACPAIYYLSYYLQLHYDIHKNVSPVVAFEC